MRPLAPVADRGWVEELWAVALPPAWPPLPAGIAMLRDGLVAEAGADPVGLVAGVGVAPDRQGRGIGTALVTRASQLLGQAGTRACHIGWTTRESFYRRAGYQPRRRYAMFSRPV
jgi:GNAT superfamily N-acetyltransferase